MINSSAVTLFVLAMAIPALGQGTIRVGSKNFTEQEILGELVAQLIEEHTDLRVERRLGLGGSGVCHGALVAGELDIYVEYTGTALQNVLKSKSSSDADAVFREVARHYRRELGLEWLPPIGFNNTYAFAVHAETAERFNLHTLSDLATVASQLKAGFPSEFMERPDGYPGLQQAYGLSFGETIEIDPGLMYQAVAEGAVDVISAFATDARINSLNLHVLTDDKHFFPPYDAAPVVRIELLSAHPEIREALAILAGTIGDDAMRKLNYSADIGKSSPALVAKHWIDARMSEGGAEPDPVNAGNRTGSTGFLESRLGELASKTAEHVYLTAAALVVALLIGIPLGVFMHRHQGLVPIVMGFAEVVQTIPSLALLAFLFAVYQVLGTLPAVTALVLYALLPIILNTYTGLKEVPPPIVEAANGIGMSAHQRLWWVEIPLALPVMVAGIRTAAVWTVGIATLSTYIGAGGLGDFINRGLARNDPRLTLLGALPAALIAVALSYAIKRIERLLKKG